MSSDRQNYESQIEWLKTPIQFAKGVGPHVAKLLERLSVNCFEDLLYHLPTRYLDRRKLASIQNVHPGGNQVVMGTVLTSGTIPLGRTRKKIFQVILKNGHATLTGKWFNFSEAYFKKRFTNGDQFLFFGEVSLYRGERQMIHPEVTPLKEVLDEAEINNFLGLIPVYPSTEGLNQNRLRKIIEGLLAQSSDGLMETLPEAIQKKWNLLELKKSLTQLHQPSKEVSLKKISDQVSPFHRRLIFEEFFYLQLGLGIKKLKVQLHSGFSHLNHGKLQTRLLQQLPFELTISQKQAYESIQTKMANSLPMNCLLQGDVGSGKTLVATLAALIALENNHQVAMMAPTEILAEQHFINLTKQLETHGISIRLLTASTKGSEKKNILQELQKGKPLLILGTHALIEDDVVFKRLSLVIVDEQHRFGVHQRMHLMKKGKRPDVLVMTATPIPRSLAMTAYGDLDLCVMRELPKGRQPIQTRIMYEKNRPKLYEFVRQKLQQGRQAYFVFPLIEESEKLDLKDATQAYEKLQKVFSEFKLAMIHGRMKSSEKDQIMKEFAAGKIHLLVATTVIEVGIDVPNATIMVIEHAERFGLSQLHQLRGRVGRGSEKSYCILATSYQKTEVAGERLKIMEKHRDGFKIAEEDLKIRGPGDFLGTRQSGMPDLRIANLVRDVEILEEARRAAQETLAADPQLNSPENIILRVMLKHRWSGRLSLAEVG